MEKLIELLNEYASEDFNWCVIDGKIFDKEDRCWTTMNVEMGVYVISKQFWFIKRLDKHNKIDRTYKKNLDYPYYIRRRDWELKWYKRYEMLIMLLSISNKPIDLLISFLK